MFTQHGYASHTPVSDGQRVYVFFGKTGVLAFDLDGKKLWQTSVGTGSGPHGWGSASSPILYKNLVIVTASAESESLVALNKETGKEVWRHKDAGFSGTWGTPILVDCGKGRTDLVIAVPYKIWGFNPDDGKLRWQCEGLSSDSICSSAIAHDGVVYAVETGPRGGGTMAVRAGGEGDVTKTRVLWRGKERSRIGTPVLENGRIYWFGSRIANCIDAATGKQVYRTRAEAGRRRDAAAGRRPDTAGQDKPGPGGPGRRPGRRIRRTGRRHARTGLFFARSGQREDILPLPVRRGVRLCDRAGVQVARPEPLCLGRRRLQQHAGHQRRPVVHPFEQVSVLCRRFGSTTETVAAFLTKTIWLVNGILWPDATRVHHALRRVTRCVGSSCPLRAAHPGTNATGRTAPPCAGWPSFFSSQP